MGVYDITYSFVNYRTLAALSRSVKWDALVDLSRLPIFRLPLLTPPPPLINACS